MTKMTPEIDCAKWNVSILVVLCALAAGATPKEPSVSRPQEKTPCESVSLFNGKDLAGWEGATHMYVVDPAEPGVLRCDQTKIDEWKTCNLQTTRSYGDFILTFECSMAKGANNGVGIRMPKTVKTEPAMEAFCEVQLIDDDSSPKMKPHQHTGSVYGIIPAKADPDGRYAKPCGEWSKYEIRVVGPEIRVTVDGRVVAEGDLSKFRGDGDTPDGWKHPGLARRTGPIAFLGHFTDGPTDGMIVRWRNIRIRELDRPDAQAENPICPRDGTR